MRARRVLSACAVQLHATIKTRTKARVRAGSTVLNKQPPAIISKASCSFGKCLRSDSVTSKGQTQSTQGWLADEARAHVCEPRALTYRPGLAHPGPTVTRVLAVTRHVPACLGSHPPRAENGRNRPNHFQSPVKF